MESEEVKMKSCHGLTKNKSLQTNPYKFYSIDTLLV